MAQSQELHLPFTGEASVKKPYGQEPAPGDQMRTESATPATIHSTEKGILTDWSKSASNPDNTTLTIEYDHGKEGKVRVTYDNVSGVQLPKDGKTYDAGQAIGAFPKATAGKTGSVGISIQRVMPDGTVVKADPVAYFADLREKGAKESLKLIDENGEDLIASLDKAKTAVKEITEPKNTETESKKEDNLRTPEEWSQWLSKQQQTETKEQTQGMSHSGGDIFTSIIAAIVKLMFALKAMEFSKEEEQNKKEAQEMLKGKEYEIPVEKGHAANIHFDPATRQATLRYDLGQGEKTVSLGELHVSNMTAVIQDNSLTDEQKSQRLDGMVKQIDAVAMAQAMQSGQNFEVSLDQNQNMQQTR